MIPLTLIEIADAVEGKLTGADSTIEAISTDSRALTSGAVFLALRGANFDGHKFVEQAQQANCSAVIVDHLCDINIPQIVVKDTHQALGLLGAYVKAKVAPKTVGITGSSGKTTVKEMVAAILARLGKVLATNGNFNNDIGVPLTLLRLEHDHDFAVIEMGANHMGEISYTSGLTKPDIAVINNIAAAHLEGFGDLCGVARAKGEIYEGLSEGGVALYNQDCKLANKWQWRLVDKKVRTFSCVSAADCYSSDVVLDENGCAAFTLHVVGKGSTFIELTIPGRHNVCNAVAAALIAVEFGASLDDIRLGLAEMAPVKGRLNLYQINDNFKLIDDSYNANVESMKAACDLTGSYPGRTILIFGDMGELGADARGYHQEVGEYAAGKNIDDMLTLGVLSQATSDAFERRHQGRGQHFNTRDELICHLQNLLANEQQQISILVKGSRSSRMELVVEDILNWRNGQKHEEIA